METRNCLSCVCIGYVGFFLGNHHLFIFQFGFTFFVFMQIHSSTVLTDFFNTHANFTKCVCDFFRLILTRTHAWMSFLEEEKKME
jgi:hypothetical protein